MPGSAWIIGSSRTSSKKSSKARREAYAGRLCGDRTRSKCAPRLPHSRLQCRNLSSLRCGTTLNRTIYAYQPDTERDRVVREALLALADQQPRWGFRLVFDSLRRSGHQWNHKRVHRVYAALGLNPRRKAKLRLSTRNPEPLSVPEQVNQSWSMGFVSDALENGHRFRTFNVIDDYNREALAIEIDLSLPAPRVTRVLDRLVEQRGYPRQLRSGNGPEFISITLAEWAERHGVHLEVIKPRKPTQNSYVERFNRTYREEILDAYIFRSLTRSER